MHQSLYVSLLIIMYFLTKASLCEKDHPTASITLAEETCPHTHTNEEPVPLSLMADMILSLPCTRLLKGKEYEGVTAKLCSRIAKPMTTIVASACPLLLNLV